ncbi:hypothetical protein A2671_01025 [Candidatus Kaiserbacteria bacterium RIFCSPHIGHO2_01_FULL_49_13]|uniref:General secretion pathway GspH domain-containing protein n=1 Tax=Candidatus Kaiserbacteria bacterium RIFCSPHIGHO2_01_FULL_49_13 TaxID=1798477 RepID=A0A1F6CDR0_9BACT|nr:MAG: hypothetical protein A2671_01025 [Candidatus Kaiserbacteria bacterium RIFCSPHIGHO2_01_FULL_49_13]
MELHNISNAKGFTVIELLIVLAIATLISSIGLIYGYDTFTRSSVRSQEDTLGRLLQTARARAISNVNQSPHGVHIDPDKYVLFSGLTYDPLDPENEPFPRNSSVIISTDPSGMNNFVFAQLSGDASPTGTIVLNASGQNYNIVINSEGGIDW